MFRWQFWLAAFDLFLRMFRREKVDVPGRILIGGK
jgi:hypothetical protein